MIITERLPHHTTGEPRGKGEPQWRDLSQVSSRGHSPGKGVLLTQRCQGEGRGRQAKEKSAENREKACQPETAKRWTQGAVQCPRVQMAS